MKLLVAASAILFALAQSAVAGGHHVIVAKTVYHAAHHAHHIVKVVKVVKVVHVAKVATVAPKAATSATPKAASGGGGGGAWCTGGCVGVVVFQGVILAMIVGDEVRRTIDGPACATNKMTRQSYFGVVRDEPKLWRKLCNYDPNIVVARG
jgi:hypothetical protein